MRRRVSSDLCPLTVGRGPAAHRQPPASLPPCMARPSLHNCSRAVQEQKAAYDDGGLQTPDTAWAVQQFWRRQQQSPVQASAQPQQAAVVTPATVAQRGAPAIGALFALMQGSCCLFVSVKDDTQAARQPPSQVHPFLPVGLSRYQVDFQEVKRLGKGGYGVVVSAINR